MLVRFHMQAIRALLPSSRVNFGASAQPRRLRSLLDWEGGHGYMLEAVLYW